MAENSVACLVNVTVEKKDNELVALLALLLEPSMVEKLDAYSVESKADTSGKTAFWLAGWRGSVVVALLAVGRVCG